MSVIRAFGMRVDLPRAPVRDAQDVPDLSTWSQRDAGAVPIDALHIAPPRRHWTPLAGPIAGTLVSGTLPPDQRARFVLRLPAQWNGRLVVAAASGVTDENTYDVYFSDYLLSRGYAFAATDKGVRRALLDGDTVLIPLGPDASIRRWLSRLEALAALARAETSKHYGRAAEKTYAVGLSNGGYLARRAAETGLVDGAVEVSGVLWRPQTNLLTELPVALRATSKTPWDRQALADSGFPGEGADWDPVVAQYRAVYWDSVMHLFLGDLDPSYSGPVEDYDLASRPASVREAIATFANTGDLKCPLVSIAGRRDYLISCRRHAEDYRDLVAARGKSKLHRMHLVDNASHIDSNAETFPFVEPLMPRAHAVFEELTAWVEGGTPAAR